MSVSNVTESAIARTSPTGRYGVVIYSFAWDGFAETGKDLVIGDALAGGLYPAKDSTLILRYLEGYTITSAEPRADQQRDSLIWYGQRSFAAGVPRIVLNKPGFPVVPVATGFGILVIAGLGLVQYHARKKTMDRRSLKSRLPLLSLRLNSKASKTGSSGFFQ